MSQNNLSSFYRYVIVMILLFFGVVVIIGKIITISTTQRSEWHELGKHNRRDSIEVAANRGNIYAAGGELLAATIPYYRIRIDFGVCEDKQNKNYETDFYNNIDSLALCLSKKLGDKSKAQYKKELISAFNKKNKNGKHLRYYLVSKKEVLYMDLQEIKKFPFFRKGANKSGLIVEKKLKRIKPFGILAERTIGNTYDKDTVDNKGKEKKEFAGQFGLEASFEKYLKGESGICKMKRSGRRNSIEIYDVPPVDGMDIITTLDISIQDVAETELLNMLSSIQAQKGCAIVMETKTGEIKAIANLNRDSNGNYHEWTNVAFTELTEPGSTFKTASFIVAMEDGYLQPNDYINTTEEGYWLYANRRITDSHYKKDGSGYGYGTLTATNVLAKSSNIGTAKIIDSFYHKKPDVYVDKILKLGFLTKQNFDINTNAKPYCKHPNDKENWDGTSLAWLSFGYNSQIPPIYTLMFYNAIANNGKMIKPFLVKYLSKNGDIVKTFETETVNSSICSQSTLSKIKSMLDSVVDSKEGTGHKYVQSQRFKIAGKTGTAQIQGGHHLSFCGYFPADDPQYTCIVSIFNPKLSSDAMSGGAFSGSVFRKIAEKIYANSMYTKTDTINTNDSKIPVSKDGIYYKLHTVLKHLGIDEDGDVEKNDCVNTNTETSFIKITKRETSDYLVPNVIGMGARDAVFLLEKHGLSVRMTGRGKVYHQSVAPGTTINGQTVYLSLKN